MNHLFSNAKVINPRLKIDTFLEIVFPIIVLNKDEVSWQASLLSDDLGTNTYTNIIFNIILTNAAKSGWFGEPRLVT